LRIEHSRTTTKVDSILVNRWWNNDDHKRSKRTSANVILKEDHKDIKGAHQRTQEGEWNLET
jgi:hypothetical protein